MPDTRHSDSPTLPVAVVQAHVAPTLAEGLERTESLARQAAGGGARLIAFPETWLPGYPAWLDVCRDAALWDHPPVKAAYRRMMEHSVTVPGPATERLAALARETEAVLVIGIVERVDVGAGQGTLFNAVLTFDADGTLANHHRKLIPTYTERMVWGPGDADGLRAAATAAGRVGALVCWEHWMPLARQAMHDSGEDVHVALWPTAHEMLQVASRSYAFEGRCFTLVVGSLMRASALPEGLEVHPGRAPAPESLVMRGGSAIIGPDGRYLAGPVYDEPALITASLDLGRLAEERMTLDVSGHYARADLLRLEVTRGKRA